MKKTKKVLALMVAFALVIAATVSVTVAYLKDDDSAKKQKLGELEKLLNDILPVTYTEDESYRYVNAVVLERDETDNYRQCWFSGENTMFWQDVSERAMELINQSIQDKAVVHAVKRSLVFT